MDNRADVGPPRRPIRIFMPQQHFLNAPARPMPSAAHLRFACLCKIVQLQGGGNQNYRLQPNETKIVIGSKRKMALAIHLL